MSKPPKPLSPGEETLALHLDAYKIPYTREVKFCNGRDWKFDFLLWGGVWAIEVEGGSWSRGRHTRGQGMADDAIKYNEATLLGFKVLRFTTEQVSSGLGIDTILRAIGR